MTSTGLPDYRLSASSRTAREIAGTMFDDLELNPPYQRGAVWTLDQRRALVKSWIMGLPVPAIILNDRTSRNWKGPSPYRTGGKFWAVIDGKQRIETARYWFKNELAVPRNWFASEAIEDKGITPERSEYITYQCLTMVQQREFGNQAQLPIVEAKLSTVKDEAEIYLLVNGGGTAQTNEDIRRAKTIAERMIKH